MEDSPDIPLYTGVCERYNVDPSPVIIGALREHFAAGLDVVELVVDNNAGDAEVLCLIEFLKQDWSSIAAVDLKVSGNWNSSVLVNLLTAPKGRLRHADLTGCSYKKEFIRMLSKPGLNCKTLKLGACNIKKLSLSGTFPRLELLTVDLCRTITLLSSSCFDAMPKLAKLSICGTSILNLWTTCHALSKLPNLEELRFQRCTCCDGTNHCTNSRSGSDRNFSLPADRAESSGDEAVSDTDYSDQDGDDEEQEEIDDEMEENDQDHLGSIDPEAENVGDDPNPAASEDRQMNYVLQSAICYEKFYRQFVISSLPKLKVLDNVEITEETRKKAWDVYCDNFERLGNFDRSANSGNFGNLSNLRQRRQNLLGVLNRRERGGNPSGSNSRALAAAKLCDWVATSIVYNPCKSSVDIGKRLKPRQFEYHPKDPGIMVLGTLNGELAVVNYEEDRLVAYIQAASSQHRVLGLCWLTNEPDKFIAGSDNGVLELYSLSRMRAATLACTYGCSSVHRFNDFEQLTSVHVNAQDELFLASGYNKNIGLYDLQTAKLVKVFPDLHQDHINVVKFANHSPKLFATSSFDKTMKMWDLRTSMTSPVYCATSRSGNVMLCFSNDDHFVLVSAVDNEVRQYLAADGRLHTKFDITPVNSRRNYTRSYYMNGRDYIITGSCEENRVRIYSSQTGRRLKDVTLEGRGLNNSLYVQSLRGDPFRDFHLCVLAAYNNPHHRSEIVKINMVSSSSYVGPTDHQSMRSGGSVSGA